MGTCQQDASSKKHTLKPIHTFYLLPLSVIYILHTLSLAHSLYQRFSTPVCRETNAAWLFCEFWLSQNMSRMWHTSRVYNHKTESVFLTGKWSKNSFSLCTSRLFSLTLPSIKVWLIIPSLSKCILRTEKRWIHRNLVSSVCKHLLFCQTSHYRQVDVGQTCLWSGTGSDCSDPDPIDPPGGPAETQNHTYMKCVKGLDSCLYRKNSAPPFTSHTTSYSHTLAAGVGSAVHFHIVTHHLTQDDDAGCLSKWVTRNKARFLLVLYSPVGSLLQQPKADTISPIINRGFILVLLAHHLRGPACGLREYPVTRWERETHWDVFCFNSKPSVWVPSYSKSWK